MGGQMDVRGPGVDPKEAAKAEQERKDAEARREAEQNQDEVAAVRRRALRDAQSRAQKRLTQSILPAAPGALPPTPDTYTAYLSPQERAYLEAKNYVVEAPTDEAVQDFRVDSAATALDPNATERRVLSVIGDPNNDSSSAARISKHIQSLSLQTPESRERSIALSRGTTPTGFRAQQAQGYNILYEDARRIDPELTREEFARNNVLDRMLGREIIQAINPDGTPQTDVEGKPVYERISRNERRVRELRENSLAEERGKREMARLRAEANAPSERPLSTRAAEGPLPKIQTPLTPSAEAATALIQRLTVPEAANYQPPSTTRAGDWAAELGRSEPAGRSEQTVPVTPPAPVSRPSVAAVAREQLRPEERAVMARGAGTLTGDALELPAEYGQRRKERTPSAPAAKLAQAEPPTPVSSPSARRPLALPGSPPASSSRRSSGPPPGWPRSPASVGRQHLNPAEQGRGTGMNESATEQPLPMIPPRKKPDEEEEK